MLGFSPIASEPPAGLTATVTTIAISSFAATGGAGTPAMSLNILATPVAVSTGVASTNPSLTVGATGTSVSSAVGTSLPAIGVSANGSSSATSVGSYASTGITLTVSGNAIGTNVSTLYPSTKATATGLAGSGICSVVLPLCSFNVSGLSQALWLEVHPPARQQVL